jgi:hypothetical protein
MFGKASAIFLLEEHDGDVMSRVRWGSFLVQRFFPWSLYVGCQWYASIDEISFLQIQ